MEEGRRAAAAVARRHGAALVLALVIACGDAPPPPSAPRVGTLLAALLGEADGLRSPWRCAALDTPSLSDREFTAGKARWKVSANALRRVGADDTLVIGIVADAAGAPPRTVAALARLRAALDKQGLDLVITLGGMGATQAELEATLGTLAERASWPVVALPGDLEPTTEHLRALDALRKRGAHVLDGRLVRWIELPGATIGTLPGAGASARLVAGADGCAWRAADVAAVYTVLTAKPGIRVTASSEGPRGMVAGEPAGELDLVPPQPVEVALHGPLTPAPTGVKAGGRDGARVPISPGTSDATRRLPDAHAPSAGVLVIRGGTWTWRPVVDAK